MNTLQTFFKFLFGNLTRQVVAIHGGGLSLLCKRLIILEYCIIMLRFTATSISLHFDFATYFEYDVVNRQAYYQTSLRHKHIEYFFFFLPGFSIRLFYLNFLSADSLVWKHLYDLIVRNREQMYRQWWWARSRDGQNIWWSMLSRFCPRLKVPKSSKLLYYPKLSREQRIKCTLVCFAFEGMTTFTLSFVGTFLIIVLYATMMKDQLSAVQVLFVTAIFQASVVHIGLLFIMIYLAMMTLYQISHIYVDQYRKVNFKLANVKDKLIIESNGDQQRVSTSLKISIAANAFRTVHARLTVFILHYNESTVSKIIAATLQYVLPLHAYCSVLIYFQNHDMEVPFIINLSFGLTILWLNLIALNLVVVRVNKEICRSAPTVGAIFARKGVLEGRRKQCSWFKNSVSFWSREALKLSTYYEMIWRSDKELAFTAGKTATMNWMFIVDLSIRYSTFVLFFGGKFISKLSSPKD